MPKSCTTIVSGSRVSDSAKCRRAAEKRFQPHQPTSGPLGSYTYGDAAHADAATAIGTGSSSYTASYDEVGHETCRAAPGSGQTCAGSAPTGAMLGYDNEERLYGWQNSQTTSPTERVAYLSDGAGNRVQQQRYTLDPSSGVTTTTTTSYVGRLEEVTSSDAPGAQTTTTTAYYGSVAESVNGALSYLLSDGLGSVSEAVSTSTGAVTATQLYGPYGAVRYQSGTLPTDKGYTGQRADAATSGLDYYGARYYDPVAEQFTSADTTLAGGLNRFAYVAGNPETRTDPTGHYYAPGDSGSGGESWVDPNNKNFPNTRDALHQHVGYPGQYQNVDADTKGPGEDVDGLKLWAYFGAEWQDANGQKHHEGPDVWKIYADWGKAFQGTSADYLVGYPTVIVTLCGVRPCLAMTLAPLTPVDLYTPQATTSTNRIMSWAVGKGQKQAAIIAIDVTDNKGLHGDAEAQAKLGSVDI